jgi:hypothetical protein
VKLKLLLLWESLQVHGSLVRGDMSQLDVLTWLTIIASICQVLSCSLIAHVGRKRQSRIQWRSTRGGSIIYCKCILAQSLRHPLVGNLGLLPCLLKLLLMDQFLLGGWLLWRILDLVLHSKLIVQ